MPQYKGRFEWVAKLAYVGLIAGLTCLGLAIVATVAGAITAPVTTEGWTALAPWVAAFVGELAAGAWIFIAYGAIRILVSSELEISKGAAMLNRIETLLEDQASSVKKVAGLVGLTDQAKRVIFHDQEIEALREAVHGEILKQNYTRAETLIGEVEKELGHTEEAANLREEVANSRKATLEEKVDTVVERIQGIIEVHDWSRAIRQAQRSIRLFPDNAKLAALPERIEAARIKHKRGLLQQYGEAVRKNDVDLGIELLKKLDTYLTPQEAAALQESARGVFRTKLHNLGVQFAICVTDERWGDAVATGREIVGEYPNTRMAQEVRMKMDQLRAKAANAEAAQQPQQQP